MSDIDPITLELSDRPRRLVIESYPVGPYVVQEFIDGLISVWAAGEGLKLLQPCGAYYMLWIDRAAFTLSPSEAQQVAEAFGLEIPT